MGKSRPEAFTDGVVAIINGSAGGSCGPICSCSSGCR